MGYRYDKDKLKAARNRLGMTVEETAWNLGISVHYLKLLMYSDGKSISTKLLRSFEEIGINAADLGIDASKPPRGRGRPPRRPAP